MFKDNIHILYGVLYIFIIYVYYIYLFINKIYAYINIWGLPWWLSSKEYICQHRRLKFDPWIGKIPQRRKWQPTPVFLPGKSHGKKSLVDYTVHGVPRVRHNLVTEPLPHKHICMCVCVYTHIQFKAFWFNTTSSDIHMKPSQNKEKLGRGESYLITENSKFSFLMP